MRIGVLGGTFDPPHVGHLIAASVVADDLSLDLIFFSPTGHSWHKDSPTVASGDLRFRMVQAAVGSDARFEATSVDIDRDGPTYSIDTLEDLRSMMSERKPGLACEWFFIMGADALADVSRWREPDTLMQRAHLVGVTRKGHALQAPHLPASTYTLVDMPVIGISSTDIRERLAHGRRCDYLVPAAVLDVIEDSGLYRG